MLSFKHDERFKRIGIDIDDSAFGRMLDTVNHRTGPDALEPLWEDEWDDFWRRHPKAKKAEVFEKLKELENMRIFSTGDILQRRGTGGATFDETGIGFLV